MHAGPYKMVPVLLLCVLLASTFAIAFSPKISASPSFAVTIQSPSTGAVFNRGQVVTITASVTSGNSPVSGASVFAITPTGASIAMPETTNPGTYSTHYAILPTDPVGAWTISVGAIKGGQTASANVVVSISGLLKVAIISPPLNTKFNVGEMVTVRATAILQDGSPLGSSATVGFSRPTGGFVPIGIDLSDPSGKTWAGGYSILTSDVPVDGFVWPLTLTAISNGNTATSVQGVTLYKTLAVAVSTFSSAAYNVPKDTFAKGETVFVKGVADLQDGKVVSLGSVAFEISGTNVAATPVAMAFSSTLSAWTGSYTLLSTDQSGSQVVTVSAGDLYGNSGSGSHQISVGGPTTGGLFVSITSPLSNSIYNRGETVTVSATVTKDGAPVTGASVQATAPSGAILILTGGAGGTYSAQYQITNADPVGPWSLTVTAHQGTQSASARVVPAISSALKVSVIAPASGAEFNVGQTVTVKALVTYQDGSAIPAGASVSFNGPISGVVAMSVDLSDSSHKTWTGTHAITTSDVPTDGETWNLVVSASVGGNTGSSVPTAVRLFISHLGVVVSTWSSSSFTVPKDGFARGDTVFVKARVTLPDGTVVSSGAVNFKITGTSVANSAVSLTFSASMQAWVGSYTLLQTDGTGNQVVSVTASDSSGNHGTGAHTIGIEVPVPAPQPLEAKITFDPHTKDIAVKAVCNLGCVAPTSVSVTSSTLQNHGGHSDDEDDDNNGDGVLRTYTITDSGGHTLVLKVLVKTEGHELKAQLLSIQYGSSAPINMPHNELTFRFSSGRNGASHLEQSIDVKDVVNAQASFDSRKNVTHIHIETQNGDEGDDNNDNGQNIKLDGLWLLDLETSNGSLGVNYFQAV